jgi:hypothetical protein
MVFVFASTVFFLSSCASKRVFYKDYEEVVQQSGSRIMGSGMFSKNQLAGFLMNQNTDLTEEYADYLASLYIYEANMEGVNHDIAFAQMCLETGFLKFDGIMDSEQNNFAGLGAVDNRSPGEHFPSAAIGVRAHIQHLKAYASTESLRQPQVDNRFHYVQRGSAPNLDLLEGRWSTDHDYAEKIMHIMDRILNNNP